MVRRPAGDLMAETDQWFLAHGLTYFVPETRAAVRQALRPVRVLPLLLVVLLVGTGGGGAFAWVADQVSLGPAKLGSLLLLAATWYGGLAFRALSSLIGLLIYYEWSAITGLQREQPAANVVGWAGQGAIALRHALGQRSVRRRRRRGVIGAGAELALP